MEYLDIEICPNQPSGEGFSSKFDGGGDLSQYMGGLKRYWKIPVKEFIC